MLGILGSLVSLSLASGCASDDPPEPGEATWSIALSGRFAPSQLPMCETITSTLELVAHVDDSGLVLALSPADTDRFRNHELTIDDDGDIDFEMSTGELSAMREDWDLSLFRGDGYYAGTAVLTLFDDGGRTRCKAGYNASHQLDR